MPDSTRLRPGKSGQLAYEILGIRLPLEVLPAARGFYLGTANDAGPVSRESLEYYPTIEAAEAALESNPPIWTQRDHP